MHAGLLIYGELDTISGGYLYDRMLVEYLERQGDTVEVISIPQRSYTANLMDNFSSSLLSRLARLPVDVLLQDELNHPSLFRLNHALNEQVRYPIVSIVHHLRSSEARPAFMNKFYAWIERQYLSTVDGFVFNSQTTRQAVERLLLHSSRGERYQDEANGGIHDGGHLDGGHNDLQELPPSVIAYPAGDRLRPRITTGEITWRTLQPDSLRLLFLGNVIPRKGLHTLLSALSRLPASDWLLSVAGRLDADPAYARSVYRQVVQNGFKERVLFLGPLDETGLAVQMRANHMMAVPSSYEGFGIVYLEGMGYGLPGVAGTCGAAGEIITHGKNGFLVPPGDPATLARYLAEVVQDRERLLALSLAARRRYDIHPTWEMSMRAIRRYLQSIVE